jgi:exodeoxyribonuclease-3
MKIATWNVNSIKARLGHVLAWLKMAAPDVLLLQEIKCQTGDFPTAPFLGIGYSATVHGQKAYNGVAILARLAIEEPRTGLPGSDHDEQARYVEATVAGVRVASLYLPNGNPIGTDKFRYKLDWMERLRQHAESLLDGDRLVVLGGDYNVCPTDLDVCDPAAFAGDALCQLQSRAAFRALLHLGLTDAFRARHPDEPHRYSFWDYQNRAWQRDQGLRIDHLLLNANATDRLQRCDIDRTPRGLEKASDHVPVWCEIDT